MFLDLNGCSLRWLNENDHETPIPFILNSKNHSIDFPVQNGDLIIKQNSYLKLLCAKNKYISVADKNTREIIVKCLKGDILEFRERTYLFKDFQCQHISKSNLFNQTNKNYHQTNYKSKQIISKL